MEVSEQGAAAVSEQGQTELPSKPLLLDGFRLEVDPNHLDNMLMFDLGEGKQWKKRIYPRVGCPDRLFRWCTAEEILSFLISLDSHTSWITQDVLQQPPSGTILFFDRSKNKRYRKDGYEWKKRKSLSTSVREDRMRLKVGGYQLLYGCYAHSSSNLNLHRRTYWLIHNPNIIMVHYLEVASSNHTLKKPATDDGTLDPVDTPLDWSMLTISDCNVCALLDMVNTEISTDSVLSQLSLILNNNLEQAVSLQEALVSNNAGLPFDMYLDTRSKKTSISKVDTPAPSPTISQPPTPNEPTAKGPVESLYKAPHLLMCKSQNGTVSYFVTIPPQVESSGGPSKILPSTDQSNQLPVYSSKTQPGKGCRKKKGKKGKEKAPIDDSVETTSGGSKVLGILSQMLPFVKNSTHSKPPGTVVMEQPSSSKGDDYDPERFSEFANILSSIDKTKPLEANLHPESEETNSANSNGTSVSKEAVSVGHVDDMEASEQSTLHPMNCQSTTNAALNEDFPNSSRNSDLLGLDLDSESVRQLLELSPGLTDQQTLDVQPMSMESSQPEEPLSPLTQLMNSFASPDGHNPQKMLDTNVSSQMEATDSSFSNGTWMNVCSANNVPSVPATTTFSPASLDFNPLTPSFQPHSSVPNNYSYNAPHSSLLATPQKAHELHPRPENHLHVSRNQPSFHSDFSTPLYTLPQPTSDDFSLPGSFVPAQEYQDLESLMNTVITDSEAQPNEASVVDTQSTSLSTFSRDAQSHVQDSRHHLSLPDLTLSNDALEPSTSEFAMWTQRLLSDHYQLSTQSTSSARSSSCLSASALQDIPEGSQMELEEPPHIMQQLDVYDYRTGGSSLPSSPGEASLSSHSSISVPDMFDSRSPSVLELCEMLSESPNVQQNDFLHLTLTDSEQQQLFRAAKTIQNAFRQYKDRRQVRNRQKRAALMIEKYYKEYRDAKEQQDHAARKIQQLYRDYRRIRDLNRAVLFVQQMYRYHRTKKGASSTMRQPSV